MKCSKAGPISLSEASPYLSNIPMHINNGNDELIDPNLCVPHSSIISMASILHGCTWIANVIP